MQKLATKEVPFLINIIGNICSGKSTLMDKLLDIYPEAYFLKIDDYRLKYHSINPITDSNAWEHLINDAITKKFVFVESTGASLYYKVLQQKFPGTIMTILLDASHQTCIRRYHERGKDSQLSKKYTIESSIQYVHNALELLWQLAEDRIVITTDIGIGIDYSDLEYIRNKIYTTKRIALVNNTKPYTPEQ